MIKFDSFFARGKKSNSSRALDPGFLLNTASVTDENNTIAGRKLLVECH